MTARKKDLPLPERFRLTYGREISQVEIDVDREVHGEYLASNGFTTIAQADRLVRELGLKAGRRLLEIGAGRGWPGVYLAHESGCDVVLTDVPLEALRHCQVQVKRYDVAQRSGICIGNGGDLPLAAREFDAVVHTDVL